MHSNYLTYNQFKSFPFAAKYIANSDPITWEPDRVRSATTSAVVMVTIYIIEHVSYNFYKLWGKKFTLIISVNPDETHVTTW